MLLKNKSFYFSIRDAVYLSLSGPVKYQSHFNELFPQLSIWDNRYFNVSCALLTVECLQRSVAPFSYNFGLVQYDEDLASLMKVVPIVHGDETVGSKIAHLYDGPWLSWWYRPKDTEKVSNVVFRFEFKKVATLKLEFYGIKHEFKEPEPPKSKWMYTCEIIES